MAGTGNDTDLDRQVELFGMKSSVRGVFMLLLSHSHEHLGQSIAYARAAGITPPWTAKHEGRREGSLVSPPAVPLTLRS